CWARTAAAVRARFRPRTGARAPKLRLSAGRIPRLMSSVLRTLIVAASPELAGGLTARLAAAGLEVSATRAADGSQLVARLREDRRWDLVACAQDGDPEPGAVQEIARRADPHAAVVVLVPDEPPAQLAERAVRAVAESRLARAERRAQEAVGLRDRALEAVGH